MFYGIAGMTKLFLLFMGIFLVLFETLLTMLGIPVIEL
jgi:hypothetical protein